jgi:hypothetical protein
MGRALKTSCSDSRIEVIECKLALPLSSHVCYFGALLTLVRRPWQLWMLNYSSFVVIIKVPLRKPRVRTDDKIHGLCTIYIKFFCSLRSYSFRDYGSLGLVLDFTRVVLQGHFRKALGSIMRFARKGCQDTVERSRGHNREETSGHQSIGTDLHENETVTISDLGVLAVNIVQEHSRTKAWIPGK